MKKIIAILSFLTASTIIFAQSGIEFSHSEWKEILAQAKKENKIVFVDAYTTWCGPCKMMSNKIFPLQTVGDFYNKNFVNAKIDMEKGEGVTIAKQYKVNVYPTYLFVNGDGELVHRAVGYIEEPAFLKLGANALDPNKQLGTLQTRFEKGERSADFLSKLAFAQRDAYASFDATAAAYLEVQKDWTTPEARTFIFELMNNMNHPAFKDMLANRAAYETQFGKEKMTQKLQNTVYKEAFTIVQTDKRGGWEKVANLFKTYFPTNAPSAVAQFKIQYFGRINNNDEMRKAYTEYCDKYAEKEKDWSSLNEAAWTYYETVDDKAELKKAFVWAQKSIKIKDAYFNNDTAAALAYKLGNKKQAKSYALKAIDLAKKEEQDATTTEELLEKIKAMK